MSSLNMIHPIYADIQDLPDPPAGKTGWPWTEGSAPAADRPAEGADWPSVTIVMPSFNQAGFLEEAIRSVILQGYPRLEFVIRDAGSTDGSVEILRKYDPWISHWVSQPDAGQCHAINDAFQNTSGEIFSWLCSDDILYPDALTAMAQEFVEHPGTDVVCGWGRIEFLDEPEKSYVFQTNWDRVKLMPFRNSVPQQSTFVKRMALDRQSLLDVDMDFYMDYELWCYLLDRGARWRILPKALGSFRMYGENKTALAGERKLDELETVYRRYRREKVSLAFWYRRFLFPIEVWADRTDYPRAFLLRRISRRVFMHLLGPFYGKELTKLLAWPTYYATRQPGIARYLR